MKTGISVGVVRDDSLSLHLPIDMAYSNTEFQFFAREINFADHQQRTISKYRDLFIDKANKRTSYQNVVLTIELYGSDNTKTFSKIISAFKRDGDTKVGLFKFNLKISLC